MLFEMCELHIITVVEWEYLALFPKRPTSEAATIEAHKPLLVISNRKEIRTTLNRYGSSRNQNMCIMNVVLMSLGFTSFTYPRILLSQLYFM